MGKWFLWGKPRCLRSHAHEDLLAALGKLRHRFFAWNYRKYLIPSYFWKNRSDRRSKLLLALSMFYEWLSWQCQHTKRRREWGQLPLGLQDGRYRSAELRQFNQRFPAFFCSRSICYRRTSRQWLVLGGTREHFYGKPHSQSGPFSRQGNKAGLQSIWKLRKFFCPCFGTHGSDALHGANQETLFYRGFPAVL